jgi:predicted RNA-binding Zn-ribbon protein involved in translation (DUF1610 family)
VKVIDCPKCGKHIMDTNEDGTKRLRSKVILFRDDGAVAVCPACKAEIPVPLTLNAPGISTPVKHFIIT